MSDEQHALALPPLPLALFLQVLSLLPVDSRLRCAGVSRGWRDAARERSLWTHVELLPRRRRGVDEHDERADAAQAALLHAVAVRAGGRLAALCVHGRVPQGALRAVVRANAASLRELRLFSPEDEALDLGDLAALLAAAPALTQLEADAMVAGVPEACDALRGEGPLARLRLRRLRVVCDAGARLADADALAHADALAAGVAAHDALRELELVNVRLGAPPAALDALAYVALRRRLRALRLVRCGLGPASVPALAALLRAGALTTLYVEGGLQERLLDAPAAATLADALAACASLTALQLSFTDIWHDAAAGNALLAALTGHAAVRDVCLMYNAVADGDRAAVGAALGALVRGASGGAALTRLDVSLCDLGDEGLAPLCDALPAATTLRSLCATDNGLSHAFAAARLLPAVRANSSLCALSLEHDSAAAHDAEALVAHRAAQHGE